MTLRRRRFDHLAVELSVALGAVVPRYALWLYLGELGLDPDHLGRGDVLLFVDEHLDAFLRSQGLSLRGRERKGLRRRIAHYDPRFLTPYERMERLARATR